MQKFYHGIGVEHVLSGHEVIIWNDRDTTFKRGSRCAYFITVSEGLILLWKDLKSHIETRKFQQIIEHT